MISVRSNWPAFSELIRKYACSGISQFDAGRDVDERSARPHRRIERSELVVTRRDDRTEVLLDQMRVLAQRGIHIAEQDPQLLEVRTVLVVYDFRFVLRSDACEILALGFGDAELLVGPHHLFGKLVPLVDLLALRTQVVVDVLEVDVGHVDREPLGHRLALEQLEGRAGGAASSNAARPSTRRSARRPPR